jgi:hypothetical protein
MKVLTGHLTNTDKKAVTAIMEAGLNAGKVGKATYYISNTGTLFTVKKVIKDRGLIPCAGSSLRFSTYTSTFIK